LACHCRQKEILAKRRRRSEGESNKFAPLLSKVCRRRETRRTPMRKKRSQQGVGVVGRHGMSYGAVRIEWHDQEGQKCSK